MYTLRKAEKRVEPFFPDGFPQLATGDVGNESLGSAEDELEKGIEKKCVKGGAFYMGFL